MSDSPSALGLLTGRALNWLVEHRRQSGAPEKAIERLRQSNRAALERFFSRGEPGSMSELTTPKEAL